MFDVLKALWGSLFDLDASYYPRRAAAANKISSEEMLEQIGSALHSVNFEIEDSKRFTDYKVLIDRVKDSLEEVKKQTEYQDGKAGRLLTIVAFLTAAVGTVFSKFIDLYPLHNGTASVSETSWWIVATYAMFGLYLLLVGAGAMVTFHAMSSRFVWPGGSNLADKDKVRSVLFYQEIIRTKPEAWGKAFAGDKTELLATYYKNYVAEAYLIATKVADKLRYLDPGQRLLLLGIRVLLALFVLIIVTFAVLPPTKTDAKAATAASTSSTPGTESGASAPRAAASNPAAASTPAAAEAKAGKSPSSK